MVVKVKLFATFREGRFKEKDMELPERTILRDLVKPLDFPEKPAKILLVNGIAAMEDSQLRDGDVVAIFPMIAGG